VADLRGKRVSLSTEGSGTNVTARAVLADIGLPTNPSFPLRSSDKAVDLLQMGKLDAVSLWAEPPSICCSIA